jgi:hypothetical protein
MFPSLPLWNRLSRKCSKGVRSGGGRGYAPFPTIFQ